MGRIALLIACLLPLHATLWADQAYLESLLEEAERRQLADTRGWQNLLHYDDLRWSSERRSGTRAERFFLDRDGWRDPELELRATLRAFFEPLGEESADAETQHPQCAFVARYHWLREQLGIDAHRFPQAECPRYRQWLDAIAPGHVSLVFADAYLNSPASMFGHTLLRVDPPGAEGSSRLLSYVINHAAETDETSGLVFAVSGLTGRYPGLFSVMPYYEKVKEYNHLEHRDLWEYNLGLSQSEVDQLMRHVWELRGVSFPYYFLYQNCSYRLLRLLEVARPGLELSDRFTSWAIPTDTVRVTLEPEGMLTEAVFRPSSRTLLSQQLDMLTQSEADILLKLLAEGPNVLPKSMPEIRQQLVLESAYDLLHYRLEAGDDVKRERMHALLIARSRLGPPVDSPAPGAPATRPDEGHGTLRVGIGVGRVGTGNNVALHWRPAYHDLLDPPEGYSRSAHISFADLSLRYSKERERLELERLRVIDLESFTPRDQFFKPWSWHVGGGLQQAIRPDGQESLMAALDGGGGVARSPGQGEQWLLYTGLQVAVRASERLDDGVRAGVGPRVDVLHSGKRWRWRLSAESHAYTDHGPQWRLTLAQDFSLSPNLGLRLSASRESDFGHHLNRMDLRLHWYLNP